jgi:Holliday junction resolvase
MSALGGPSGARRGIQRERQVRERYEAEGWIVIRAAGSFGCFDLMAVKRGVPSHMVEVRSTKRPYDHFGPAARKTLRDAAFIGGCQAILAWWPSRGRLRLIPEAEWPT